MSSAFASELEIGLRAVREAAAVCRAVQAGITTESLSKKDKSPVTVADFASQALICRSLRSAFPDDPVIGEEGAGELRTPEGAEFLNRIVDACGTVGVSASPEQICTWIDRGGQSEYCERFWTLDPIDGTKGFLRKEQYAISLALIVEGRIEVGILGCPNMAFDPDDAAAPVGTLAWAVRGQGCRMQLLDAPDSEPRVVHTTETSNSIDARFCESVESGHSSHDWSAKIAASLGIHREPFRIDSQCKYLAVARGDADIYLRLPTKKGYQEKIWDHAGGVLVVREAGGRVTDIHGNEPDFKQGATLSANEGMVVTNGHLHEAVVAAVQLYAPVA